MANNKTNPVDIQFGKFSWPITAIASITHRISAVIIWVGLGVVLGCIYFATQSAESFEQLAELITDYFIGQFIVCGSFNSIWLLLHGNLKAFNSRHGLLRRLLKRQGNFMGRYCAWRFIKHSSGYLRNGYKSLDFPTTKQFNHYYFWPVVAGIFS